MNARHIIRGLLWGGLVALLVGSLNAQGTRAPLVLVLNGDLWSWAVETARPVQLSQWGYNSEIALSPDQTQVAYVSVARMVVEAIERQGPFGGGKLPGNLWLINTTDGAGARIADQPPEASFAVPNVPDRAIVRSTPMWSPDGTQLAWTELDYPAEATVVRLVRYAVQPGTTTTLGELPMSEGGIPDALYGRWLARGLVFPFYRFDPATTTFKLSFLVVDPASGEIRDEWPVTEANGRFVSETLYARAGAADVIAVRFNYADRNAPEWELLDLATGEMAPISGQLEQVAADVPDSLRLVWQPSPNPADYWGHLLPLQADGTPLELGLPAGWLIRRAALAPDGRALIYQPYDPAARVEAPQLYLWEAGRVQALPLPPDARLQEFAWGPMQWVVRG